LNRHNYAYADRECDNKYVTSPGYLQWRDGGEKHMNDPITVSNLQVTTTLHATTTLHVNTTLRATTTLQVTTTQKSLRRIWLKFSEKVRLGPT